jgi:SAM-dependent methyltransferase
MVIEEYFCEKRGERIERIACPVCEQDDAQNFRVAHDRLFGRPGEYHVVRCRQCGMIYTNPRPTFDSLARHYPSDYFCYELPENLTGIRRLFFGIVTRGITNRRLRLIEKVTGRLPLGTRVCDVGCSYGDLLSLLKSRRDCDVTGVDLNASMVDYCRGRGVSAVLGTLKDAAFTEQRFDLITMTEYLEHEGDPRSVLEESHRIIKPNGYLCIEVPAISAVNARLVGNYWSQLDLPRHLMFFTPATLGKLLREVGYEVVNVRFITGSVALSLLHVLGYERIGRMTTTDVLAALSATIPFLPFLPFLHEFMFLMARAVEKPRPYERVKRRITDEPVACDTDGISPRIPRYPAES